MRFAKMTVKVVAILFVFAIASGMTIRNTACAQAGFNVDQSTTGGQVLNPYPGEEIIDRQPMIGVKLPESLANLNTATASVKILFYFDGNEVSSEAQISVDYIFYVPPIPLKLGTHNILIKYKLRDITNGTESDITGMQELNWAFSVVGKARIAPMPGLSTEKASTTGRLYINIANINLDAGARAPSGGNYPDTDIKYREAKAATTGAFDFTNRFYGKTLTGHYDRNIEEITGRANDSFLFHYFANNGDVSLGDFSATSGEFSDFTISGVRMRGLKTINALNEKFRLTTFLGRSQEAQNGRYYRKTMGAKMESTVSKNDRLTTILLNSKERGPVTAFVVPKLDTLFSIQNAFRYNGKLMLNSEFAFDKHAERGIVNPAILSKDFAYKNYITYRTKRIETQAGRRTIGPTYNPTTLGSFTEADHEGSYGSFQYSPSDKFVAKTFFDEYHNNVRHTTLFDYTDKNTNSISSLMLKYPHLPIASGRYSKLYTQTDFPLGNPNTSRSESTTANAVLIKQFNDFYTINGIYANAVFSRYDIDRKSYTTTASDFGLRSDTQSYTMSARYKAFALMTYNTSINKTSTFSLFTTTLALTDSKTNTDSMGMQLNIVPFKFITNFNYKRSAQTTFTTYTVGGLTTSTLASAPKELQQILTFIYYMSKDKKVTLELEDYDKEFRAGIGTAGRSYDEQIVRMGLTQDF